VKKLSVLACALAMGACTQTAQVAPPEAALAPAPAPAAAPVAAVAEPVTPVSAELTVAEAQPPIYEPLVDMYKVNKVKYAQDLAACRAEAAPQERVARAAAQQQANGVALQAMSSLVSFVPVGGWQARRAVDAATSTAMDVGGATAAQGAAVGANATADYALVVNNCLQHRGYRLLRA
jgi:hypothetical protein